MTYTELSESVRRWARELGTSFDKSDDDWRAMLFLEIGRGCIIVDIQEVISSDKDKIPPLFEQLFQQHRPHSAALVLSVWTCEIPFNAPLADTSIEIMRRLGVESRPDRKEALIIHTANRKEAEQWKAEIHRYADKPPTLGEFEQFHPTNESGRFADLLRRSFKKIKGRG